MRRVPPKGHIAVLDRLVRDLAPNANASMLLGAYRFMTRAGGQDGIRATLSSFRMYREHMCVTGEAARMNFPRAWMLVRFYERGMLQLAGCQCCRGDYVVRAHDARHRYVCGLCLPPTRAGKGRKPAPSGNDRMTGP